MTPKEKAQQLFDEREFYLLKADNWLTVQRVKDWVVMDIEKKINIYKNAKAFEAPDNQERIKYWQDVKQEVKNLNRI